MNDIKRVIIENFQSHKKTIVEFAPNGQLTVVIGPSDTGKTAIIRALRWVLNNAPQGIDFIRAGCTFARVSIEYQSGHIVIRERSASKNQYKIIAPNTAREAPEVFEGFGIDVPLEIRKITGVQPVTIGDLELNLNLAEQLDGPFLGKSVSAGTRAKVLGKLAGTEEIDQAGKTLGTDLFHRNQDKTDLTAELADLETAISGYDYLPVMAQKIAQLEQLAETIRSGQERYEKLIALKNNYVVLSQNISSCNQTLTKWAQVETAESVMIASRAAGEKSQNLQALKSRLKDNEAIVIDLQKVLSRFQNLDMAVDKTNQAENGLKTQSTLSINKSMWATVTIKIDAAKDLLRRYANLNQAADLSAELDKSKGSLTSLTLLKNQWNTIKNASNNAQITIEKFSNIDQAESLVASVANGMARKADLTLLSTRITSTLSSINQSREAESNWEQRTAEREVVYHNALMDCGVCPTCGTVLTSNNA